MSARAATYYDLLGLSQRAQPASVRSAYRRLAQQYHPDKMPGNANTQHVMAALNEAYAVLSDPQQRARYDERIDEMRQSRRQMERRQHESFVARLDDPGEAWPWYLLFATITFCALVIGVTVYKNYVPGASVSTASAAQAVKVVRK
jgi:curved DNA-binding protein CbpA